MVVLFVIVAMKVDPHSHSSTLNPKVLPVIYVILPFAAVQVALLTQIQLASFKLGNMKNPPELAVLEHPHLLL